jgi:hypothetical protein
MNRVNNFCQRLGLLALLVHFGLVQAQSDRALGTWRTYLSTQRGVSMAQRDQEIWAATTGGVLAIDQNTNEVRTFTTIDGLSQIRATVIEHLPATDQMVLGYPDGTLDYFVDPADIRVLTDIRRSTTYTDKRINCIASDQRRMYVGTNFGLVIYELDGLRPVADVAQFADNPSTVPVIDIAVYEGRVYVLLENERLYSVADDFPNPRDPSAWIFEPDRSNLSPLETIRAIGATDFGLFATIPNTMLRLHDGQWAEYEDLAEEWLVLHTTPTSVAGSRQGNVGISTANGTRYTSFIEGNIVDLVYTGAGRYYQLMQFRGLNRIDGRNFTDFTLPGPGSNESVSVAAHNGELYIAPIGYNRQFIPQINGSGIYYYNQNADGWDNLDAATDLPTEVRRSFARAYLDDNTGTAYLGSWLQGLLELQSGEVTNFYTCLNSAISTTNGVCLPDESNESRVSGTEVDINGNLWVSTYLGTPPLSVRDVNGNWQAVGSDLFPAVVSATSLEIDSYGNAWVVDHNTRLFVYTSNGTLDVFDDGTLLTLRTGLNQGSLPSDQVLSVAEDLDGFIWVGTTQGVGVIFDPFSISQGIIVDASEPIFEQAPLLSNTVINTIAVDGGNRKWFGTDDGVFLVSPEGDDVIQQFDIDNSPLLSNRVLDIDIDQVTGEVFFATDQGLISFLGDAVAGQVGCGEVRVFPNPVFTDYQGPIVIRGSAANSIVKITTASGMLVREVESFGGQATWDGRDIRGRRVSSGVYLALIADENGENDCAGKFVVISRGAR